MDFPAEHTMQCLWRSKVEILSHILKTKVAPPPKEDSDIKTDQLRMTCLLQLAYGGCVPVAREGQVDVVVHVGLAAH